MRAVFYCQNFKCNFRTRAAAIRVVSSSDEAARRVRNGMGPISQDLARYLLSDNEKVATRCTEPVRFESSYYLSERSE